MITDEDQQEPAALVVSASGIWALRLQHSTTEVIDRINAYFGYRAIGRIVIEQRMVRAPGADKRTKARAGSAKLSDAETQDVESLVSSVDDPALRETLRKLGLARKRDKKRSRQ